MFNSLETASATISMYSLCDNTLQVNGLQIMLLWSNMLPSQQGKSLHHINASTHAHPAHTCPEVHNCRAVLLVRAPDSQLAVGVIAPALDATITSYHRARVSVAQADGRGQNT